MRRLGKTGIGMWVFALFLLALSPLQADAAGLSPKDREMVTRAETYLNAITTLSARFLQVSSNGATAEGSFYLSRPGRLRLDYDPPSAIQVIANGNFLIYHDTKLLQTSYVGLDSTPAGILVLPQIRLSGDRLTVTKVTRGPGVFEITLIQTDDSDQGRITMLFSEAPLALKQWHIVDRQGQTTTVSLFDMRTGISLDKSLFVFDDPAFTAPPEPR